MPASVRLRLLLLEDRAVPTAGYYRIADYNIAASQSTPASGLNTILQGIGNEHLNGVSQPIDLLALQEIQSQATTSQAVVNLLNGLYGPGTYSRGNLDGGTSGSGTQGIVYNTQTLQLLSESAVGTVSGSGQPRQTLRYKLHPIGYSSADDFYVYVSHYKADSDSQSEARRLVEANAIRADADALGQGTSILYIGDFNLYTSADSSFQRLVSSGNGQAFDPANRIGAWHGNSAYLDVDSQAPAVNPPSGLTGGGFNDRFDFQLASNEFFDGQGLEFVGGTYHSFGNNGTVPLNGNINAAGNTALPDLANRVQILNLLTTVTDHLPVVADYRIVTPPSVVTVQIGDGTAQRSRVAQLKVAFDQVIGYAGSPSAAFSLQKIVNGLPAGTVGLNVSTVTLGGHSEATISFTSDTTFGSLVDGRYRLTVIANQVRVGNTTMTNDSVTDFFRMFGDANGDARVDIADFGLFSTTYGLASGQTGFLSCFDFNNDGVIDIADFGQFAIRMFTALP